MALHPELLPKNRHFFHGLLGDLPTRIATKESAVALASVPLTLAILRSATAAWKIKLFCWLSAVAIVALGFFWNYWIFTALIVIIFAERRVAASERKSWMFLAASLLSLEVLGSDFAGWGTAFPKERTQALQLLGTSGNQSQGDWLDFYLPRRAQIDHASLLGFGPQ